MTTHRVKVDHGQAHIYPLKICGAVALTLDTPSKSGPEGCATIHLTPEQTAALIFSLEVSLEELAAA